MEEQKQKAIDTAVSQIEKEFGKGAIFRKKDKPLHIAWLPTGILSIDLAVGYGFPKGRIIEIYGPEGGGKTTLALHAIAETQKTSNIAAFIDVEHAIDLNYAEKLGVDTDNLLISQPDCGDDALRIAETLVRSGAVNIVVIDSVAALVPKAELEGDIGDSHIGLQARLMSQALRKLTAVVSSSACCLIFINQLRSKIGIMFGNPETTTGGKALKFYSSVRIDIRKESSVKNADADKDSNIIAYRTKVKVVKNKVAAPMKTTHFELRFGQGIDKVKDVIEQALKFNILQKNGTWLSYREERIGQGLENARTFLIGNRDILGMIREDVEAKIKEIRAEDDARILSEIQDAEVKEHGKIQTREKKK